MKSWIFLFLCSLLGSFVAIEGRAEKLLDGIAAQVGPEVVLLSDVNRIAKPIEARMRAAKVEAKEIEMMKAEVLDSLIENRLLDITAQRAEVEALDDEVDEALGSIAADNGISLETMKRSVVQQGLSYQEYRDKIAQEIVRQKLMSGMIRTKIDVSEGDVRELFRTRYANQPSGGIEAHIYHLIVPAIEKKRWALDIACQEAGERLNRIKAGENFLEVAGETTPTNPDLGWNPLQDLAPWMSGGVDALRAGQTSEVIPLDFGCSVLHLVDKREVRPRTFDEVRPELEEELYGRAFERESNALFRRLRQQTYIEKKGLFARSDQLEFDPKR